MRVRSADAPTMAIPRGLRKRVRSSGLADISGDFGAAVIEHGHAARGNGRTKADGAAFYPHFSADRLAWVNRRRKTAFHRDEARRIVCAAAFEYRVPGDAERCAPVQDRHFEPRLARVLGV